MLKSSMNRLQIHLRAHHCNLWPLLDIELNNVSVHAGEIKQDLMLDLPLLEMDNLLIIRHHGKRFGKDRILDTRSIDGQITEDRRIEILSIAIDGIDFRDKLHGISFKQEAVIGEPNAPSDWDGNFNFNGSVTISMSSTPLNWLINLRLKKPRNDNISYFSDHTKLFHYEDELKLIAEIEELLEEMQ
jgi:hypothetical protein